MEPLASAPESDLVLIERGRERQTGKLRTKVYWTLVSMAMLGLAPGLLFADRPATVWLMVGVAVIALVAAIWVADSIMLPIYALRRRLEVKNYGEQPTEPGRLPELDLGQDGFEMGAMLASIRPDRQVNHLAGLPVELAEIEKLARAGRVSEIAMESVKRDLFRQLSHQLKSPLAIMRSDAQAARQAMAKGDIALAEQSLQSVEAVNLNMAGLVEMMLSMGWIESLSERDLAKDKANISAAIMELITLRERAARGKDIRIERKVEAGLWVKGKQRLLQEMISALVDNALLYGPDGSTVVIEAKRLPGQRAVTISVTDRGPGIPPHERENVFKPYYGVTGVDERGNTTFGTRLHRSVGTGAEKSSHGLGLALVRAVAKLHGANVVLDSGPGGIGLCAHIVLAATTPPAEEDAQEG